ncbi:MAG: hypothetical protein JNM96_01340 [Bacteroidia bacterium]|nr:hypothetical protein [Bacteroidia bacterium]
MIRLSLIIFSTFIIACTSNNRQKENEEYFKAEVEQRIIAIKNIKATNDSLLINPDEVEAEINRLILLSKDVENSQAAINSAKKYFDKVSKEYNLNRSDFIDIGPGMNREEIEVSLKSNEINLFNQLIFKYSNQKPAVYTAH